MFKYLHAACASLFHPENLYDDIIGSNPQTLSFMVNGYHKEGETLTITGDLHSPDLPVLDMRILVRRSVENDVEVKAAIKSTLGGQWRPLDAKQSIVLTGTLMQFRTKGLQWRDKFIVFKSLEEMFTSIKNDDWTITRKITLEKFLADSRAPIAGS